MKIWTLFASAFLGAIVFSCSSSNDTPQNDEVIITPADYNVILSNSQGFIPKKYLINFEGLFLNNSDSFFFESSAPSLTFRYGSTVLVYQNVGQCDGNLVSYDFSDTSEFSIPIFSDLSSCVLHVTGITQQANVVFVSYVLDITSKEQAFFIRSVDLDTKEYEDYEVNKKPVKIVVSDTRLFVLTRDENSAEKSVLTVLSLVDKSEILEIDLEFNVGTMFKKTNGDIIISYPDSHTTLDSESLEATYTRYAPGSQPDFFDSENGVFDMNGNLYYVRNDSLTEQIKTIAAMHDFDKNSTVLYYFENFLNEAQLKVAYNVKSATAVSFDNINNLIVIGYEKNTVPGGGIIRITPAPNLTFVDNFDLQDTPFLISPAN